MRKLCTLDTIHNIRPIPNADAIEVGSVRGWDVVVQKDQFREGQEVLFIEPDAALPVDKPVFSFLGSRGTVDIDGKDFHVLRTAKLRGQISQGLALDDPGAIVQFLHGGEEALGVKLYEGKVKVFTGGSILGPWPFPWLLKTDSERVQNVPESFLAGIQAKHFEWYATEKIDGMSTTYVLEGDKLRVCSRNYELKTTDDNMLQLRVANDVDLKGRMRAAGLRAVQGEVFGEGVQSNRLKMKGQHLRLFGAWGIDVDPDWPGGRDAFYVLRMSDSLCDIAVPHLPLLMVPQSRAEALSQVSGMRSLVNPDCQAEGIVWHDDFGHTYKALGDRGTFKAINPQYLIKHKI